MRKLSSYLLLLCLAAAMWLCGDDESHADEAPPVPTNVLDGQVHTYDASSLGMPQEIPYGRVVCGRFTEDSQYDAVYLRDEIPFLLVNPANWDAVLEYPTLANDIAMLESTRDPGPGKHYVEDYLLTVGAIGLTRWERHTDHGHFYWKELGDEDLWRDAAMVRAVDLDGEHGEDIIGVSADRLSLLVLMAGERDYDDEEVILLNSPVTDVFALELDGQAPLEIALLSGTGLHIHALDGTLLCSHEDLRGGVATVIRNDLQPLDRLVWVGRNSETGTDMLRVVDGEGVSEASLDLGQHGIVSGTAADIDDDGDDDLLLNQRASYELIVFKNEAGVLRSEDGPQLVPFGPLGPAADNRTMPCVGDFDNDGDRDVLIPVQSTDEICIILNSKVEQRQATPELVTPVFFDLEVDEDGDTDGYLRIQLRDAVAVPDGATHVELLLFKKEDLDAGTSETPSHRFRFSIEDGPDYDTGSIALDEPEPSVYFWQHRYVEIDDHGHLRWEFAASTHAFTTESMEQDGPVIGYLTDVLSATYHSSTAGDPQRDEEGTPPASETVSTILGVTPIRDFTRNKEPVADV